MVEVMSSFLNWQWNWFWSRQMVMTAAEVQSFYSFWYWACSLAFIDYKQGFFLRQIGKAEAPTQKKFLTWLLRTVKQTSHHELQNWVVHNWRIAFVCLLQHRSDQQPGSSNQQILWVLLPVVAVVGIQEVQQQPTVMIVQTSEMKISVLMNTWCQLFMSKEGLCRARQGYSPYSIMR